MTCDMAQYAQYIDVDSFVNAYIAQEVTKHIDFAQFSDRYFVREGRLYAGPLWDLDLSMGNASEKRMADPQYSLYHNSENGDGSGDSASGFWAQRDWYAYLCRDEAFMRRVAERWREVYAITENLVKDNELGKNRIDEIAARCAPAIGRNYDEASCWSLGKKYSDLETWTPFAAYEDAIEHLRDWLGRRIAWLDAQFAQSI